MNQHVTLTLYAIIFSLQSRRSLFNLFNFLC